MDARDLIASIAELIETRELASPDSPVVLMVSGGSDSVALAYACAALHEQGRLGPLMMLHVNHGLRGDESDGDEAFVRRLAQALDIPLRVVSIDVQAICDAEKGNLEAVARRLRYEAAYEALSAFCQECMMPVTHGRIFVAHTADDRIENFYMRSIVGTGPGGFRSMRYRNGSVARPLLHASREELRRYISSLAEQGSAVVSDHGELWCEDSTNQHLDRFRAFVRYEIVPRAKDRNPNLLSTLTRTMETIADEDDYMTERTEELLGRTVEWLDPTMTSCLLLPDLAGEHVALQRRVVVAVLGQLLDPEARIERASVDGILAAFQDGKPVGGYVTNIQGNLAVSANRSGIRIEPMAAFRIRRNRMKE